MSRSTDTLSIAPLQADRARDELVGFIADPPADTASGGGNDPSTPGWFNGSRSTVAVPLYNARADIERIIDEVVAFARAVPSWDFLFIDDGSTDQTVAAFNRRVAAVNFVDPGTAARLAVIPSAPHAGLGRTFRIAALECDADHLLVLLPSFQTDWSLLVHLREALQSSEIAVVEGAPPAPGALRLARRLVARLVGARPVTPTPPQAIAVRARAAKVLAHRTAVETDAFDIEIAAIAGRLGWRCARSDHHAARPGAAGAIASTRHSTLIGRLTIVALAAFRIGLRLALRGYRINTASEPDQASPARAVHRRKAS